MTSLTINFVVSSVHEAGTYFRYHNFAQGLQKSGHRVTVFGYDAMGEFPTSHEETRDGVSYRITKRVKGDNFFGKWNNPMAAVARSMQDYPKADVTHFFQPHLTSALPALMKHKNKSSLFLYDWDDLWAGEGLMKFVKNNSFKNWWQNKTLAYLEKVLPGKVHHVTACSHYLADLAKQRKAPGATVIHNGFWPYEVLSKEQARKNLKLDPDAKYIGFMGRTVWELAWCFKALRQGVKKYENLRLAICGPTMSELEMKGLDEELKSKVDYLGQLPPLKTRDFAAAIDIGLLPLGDHEFNKSRFPIKYAEYMAANANVLCSNVGECGLLAQEMPWVVEAGNGIDDWFVAFEQMLDALYSGTLPPVDRSHILELFSWNTLGKELEQLYLRELGLAEQSVPLVKPSVSSVYH
ncbi:glycosyltransferase [Rapidithrix thailandica]|uniref:Glycosyltransferase n=1 Tax=Rapidithrix thailandica TaxID=413964 RepID=A0AAW9RXZ8_9BACT